MDILDLYRASRAASAAFHEYAKDKKVTLRQATIMQALARMKGSVAKQTELIEAAACDRSTLSDMINRLTRDGYLKSVASADDRRARAVALTPRGRSFLKRHTNAMTQAMRAAEANLG